MFVEILPDILRYMTTTICIISLFMILSRPKYNKAVYILIAAVIVVIDMVVCTLFRINDKLTEEIFYSIPFYILITCTMKVLFKDGILQWAFNCITTYILYIIIFFASYYLGQLAPLYGYGTMVFRICLFGIFILLFYRFIRPLYLTVSESWGVFILPIIGIFSCFVYLLLSEGHAYTSMDHNVVYYCFLTGVTILTYIAIIGTILSTKKKQSLKEENQRRKAVEELLLSELNSYYNFVEIAKENRHDLRHHSIVLNEYLASRDIDIAMQYLSEYADTIDSNALTEFCKNPCANAVLRVYKKRISDLGIEFIIESDALTRLPFNVIETSTVLSNILENALDATEKCHLQNKFIKLQSDIKDSKLILEVVNSCDHPQKIINGLPVSTKKDGGIGLKSVQNVLKKYDGFLSVKQSNQEFVLRLVVRL